jgi:hypothetical protein
VSEKQADIHDDSVMRGFHPTAQGRVAPDRVYTEPRFTHWFMQHVREVERTADVSSRHERVVPLPADYRYLDRLALKDANGTDLTLDELLDRTFTDGFLVLKRGRVLYERYYHGLKPEAPHLYHSITKSLASCTAANLVERGLMAPDELITAYVPELETSAYGDATIRHLSDMSVASGYTEDHESEETEDGRLDRLSGVRPKRAPGEPGAACEFTMTTVKDGEHGAVFHYMSLNGCVLGWVMERAPGLAVSQLLSREVCSKLGTQDDAYIALDGAGSAQLDGGFCSSLRDLARFGQMLCQGGVFNGRLVVSRWWIDDLRSGGNKVTFAASQDAAVLTPGASSTSCFWVSERSDHVSFMGFGMYGQMAYLNQEAELVVAKFSSQPRPADDGLTAHSVAALESLADALA